MLVLSGLGSSIAFRLGFLGWNVIKDNYRCKIQVLENSQSLRFFEILDLYKRNQTVVLSKQPSWTWFEYTPRKLRNKVTHTYKESKQYFIII